MREGGVACESERAREITGGEARSHTLKSELLTYSKMRHGVLLCGSRTCEPTRHMQPVRRGATKARRGWLWHAGCCGCAMWAGCGTSAHDIQEADDVGASGEVLQDRRVPRGCQRWGTGGQHGAIGYTSDWAQKGKKWLTHLQDLDLALNLLLLHGLQDLDDHLWIKWEKQMQRSAAEAAAGGGGAAASEQLLRLLRLRLARLTRLGAG